MSLQCPNCQGNAPDSANFCPKCGFALKRSCPKCRYSNLEDDMIFCPHCGIKLSEGCTQEASNLHDQIKINLVKQTKSSSQINPITTTEEIKAGGCTQDTASSTSEPDKNFSSVLLFFIWVTIIYSGLHFIYGCYLISDIDDAAYHFSSGYRYSYAWYKTFLWTKILLILTIDALSIKFLFDFTTKKENSLINVRWFTLLSTIIITLYPFIMSSYITKNYNRYIESSEISMVFAEQFIIFIPSIIEGFIWSIYFWTSTTLKQIFNESIDENLNKEYTKLDTNKEYNKFNIDKFHINDDWVILKKQNGCALVISRNAIGVGCFDINSNIWEESEIRNFLNDKFYKSAFTDEERKRIIQTEINTEGRITKDYIFLLSYDEIRFYFNSNNARRCLLEGKPCFYWLRSPGGWSNCVAFVSDNGLIECKNGNHISNNNALRPAMWIKLD